MCGLGKFFSQFALFTEKFYATAGPTGPDKYDVWEKLTGSCHVCKLQPPA